MQGISDVWADTVARALAIDLCDRGVTLQTREGRLRVEPMRLVTDGEADLLRQCRDALIILVLLCDERTLSRLAAIRFGRLPLAASEVEGRCYACGDAMPLGRRMGRCGWCSLAMRLSADAPVPPSVLTLFELEVSGEVRRRVDTQHTTGPVVHHAPHRPGANRQLAGSRGPALKNHVPG